MDRTKVVIIVLAIVAFGLGAMLLVGLLQGDEVDREENPVRGSQALVAEGSVTRPVTPLT